SAAAASVLRLSAVTRVYKEDPVWLSAEAMEGVMHNTMDGRDPAQLRQMISESALVFVTQHHVWDPAWVARTLLRLSTLHKVK
ncbi:unnamed protein product, partial [Laminaria digitata]